MASSSLTAALPKDVVRQLVTDALVKIEKAIEVHKSPRSNTHRSTDSAGPAALTSHIADNTDNPIAQPAAAAPAVVASPPPTIDASSGLHHVPLSPAVLEELVRLARQEVEFESALTPQERASLAADVRRLTRENVALRASIAEIEAKIRLFIYNQASFENSSKAGVVLPSKPPATPLLEKREVHERLFSQLHDDVRYVARLCTAVAGKDMTVVSDAVVLGLFGDQFAARDEHLLLSAVQMVLQTEFERCKHFGSFLRNETTLAKILRLYCRRSAGFAYLRDTLTEPLRAVFADTQLNYEINPVRVYESLLNEKEVETGRRIADVPRGLSEEEAAKLPAVQTLITERVAKLVSASRSFVDALSATVARVPYGIRFIAHLLADGCEQHFQCSEEETSSIVGGFFFLRYVNPAIVTLTPEIVKHAEPAPNVKHALVMLGKVLQGLSNGVRFGEKEPFMAVLNPYMEEELPRVRRLFAQLVDVEGLAEHYRLQRLLTVGAASEAAVVMPLGTVVELEALLVKHATAVAPQDSDPLRALLAQLPPRPTTAADSTPADTPEVRLNIVPFAERREVIPALQLESELVLDLLGELVAALGRLQAAPSGCRTLADVLHAAKLQALQQERYDSAAAVLRLSEALSAALRAEQLFPLHMIPELLRDLRRRQERRAIGSAPLTLQAAHEELLAEHRRLTGMQQAYTEYLRNAEAKTFNPRALFAMVGKQAVYRPGLAARTVGPFSYRLSELLRSGAVVAAPGFDGQTCVQLSSSQPGVITVELMKGNAAAPTSLEQRRQSHATAPRYSVAYETLLERQRYGPVEFVLAGSAGLKVNANVLLHLANKHFLSRAC